MHEGVSTPAGGRLTDRRLRLAELLATVSLVTDHAHDVAAESGLREIGRAHV